MQARAGVLTGEAAVTIGAQGQGMVAGDLDQHRRAPAGRGGAGSGPCRGSRRTLRASAAIAFDPMGEQVLKGEASPEPAWKALHVIAGRGGSGRSEGLEAPFVGRDEELALLKDPLPRHASRSRPKNSSGSPARPASARATGWEFEEFIDGLVETVRWTPGPLPLRW